MATLVLTAVGGAIGGPIGAALGGLIGQRVDRDVLFAPKGRQGPRLTELAVQTSSYGTQIPKVFGRMRIAGCVIWATDLIETRASHGGGKGQPSTTTYSYAASFAVALSTRAIRGVGRIWADGKLLRGAAGDWKTKTGFRLYLGDETQAPDPLIASAVASAPAHRGIAYAVFENLQLADFGNRIPSLTIEVIADEAPVTVGAIAQAIGDGAITAGGPSDRLDGFAASGDTIAGAAGALATACGGWFAVAGAVMTLANVPGETRAIASVTTTRTRRAIETVPAAVELSHYDPARDYQLGMQRARRGGAGQEVQRVELAAALPAGAAKTIAGTLLLRSEDARETRQVVTDGDAMTVAPGSAVTVDGDPRVWRVTRASVEAMRVTLDLVPFGAAVAAVAADAGIVVRDPDLAIGRTLLAAFELPPIDDAVAQVPQIAVVTAGTGAGWRAAALDMSVDSGVTWVAAGGTAASGVLGTLAAPLARGPATLIDEASAVEVLLAHDGMALTSADARALDRGANAAMIGDELIQFARAEQIGVARWRLGGLRRGGRGTMPSAHAAGARFALVDRDAVRLLSSAGMQVGDTIALMASGVGDDYPVRAEAAVTGVSVAPPSPVHLAWSASADGGALVTWVRRSRSGWRWSDGGDAPLGEEAERYRVTVVSTAGARDEIASAPQAFITAVERADGMVEVVVRQLGTLAASPATSIIIKEDA